MAENWQSPPVIPVTIITGFLGAGKTTLLNRMISDSLLANAALVINEFGEAGIDHLLVERSGDGVIELSDGCLCCTIRGELVDTLGDLIDRLQTGRIRRFDRIVIETTGLADPVPVLQAVTAHPALSHSLSLSGVVTVVDAVNAGATLGAHEEARRQVAVADRIVLTKSQLADDTSAVRTAITALNPLVPILDGDGVLSADQLFNTGAWDPAKRSVDVQRWLSPEPGAVRPSDGHHHHGHHHHHHHQDNEHDINRHGASIRAESLVSGVPMPPQALAMFLDLLRSAHGPNLLRMKGIVLLSDDPTRPVIIHAVQALMSDPVRLDRWPEGARRETRIVVITEGMPEGFVADLFAAFNGEPKIDRPDAQAMRDNPLAIPGAGTFRP